MEMVIRATAIYWFLWLVVRGTGKRSLAEISPLDLVIIVVMGDLVQQGATGEDMSVTGAVIVISVLVVWAVLGDWLGRRSSRAERILSGEPVILVKDGLILEDRARRERVTRGDVLEAAREQGIGSMASIRYGVMEPDGKFSFITGDRHQQQDGPSS